tara:strand:+ start:857 stop:2077 length:1221 start_codon:yes stop_codon:yes gene_type:complete
LEIKNIIYASYDGLTDPLGQSQILPYLFRLNLNKSYYITIISFEKPQNYLLNNKLISKQLATNKINWIPLKYTKRPPIISTIWDIYKLKKAIKKISQSTKINLIHSRSYITSLVALKINKKYNVPFIFDMRGFYADERLDGNIWNKNHFIYKRVYNYFKRKEKEFLQFTDTTISLTKAGKEEILSWDIPNLSTIQVIPCCSDELLFQEKNVREIRSKIGVNKNDFVISYVGSIGTWYMLDEMLDFFKLLHGKKSNSKLLFITKDNPKLILEKIKNKKIDIESIKIQSSSREMMPSYISASNVSIFFILPLFSKKASCPTKMGEIMNLGIPIICNSGIGDVEEIMKLSMPELLIEKFTNKEYNKIIDLIINDFKIEKNKIIEISHKYFSLKKGAEKFSNIYRQILNQ